METHAYIVECNQTKDEHVILSTLDIHIIILKKFLHQVFNCNDDEIHRELEFKNFSGNVWKWKWNNLSGTFRKVTLVV